MNSVERVKKLCKEKKIPISKLEKDLEFSNGYIGQLKRGVFPDDRLRKIADYLGVTVEYLMTGKIETINKGDSHASDECSINGAENDVFPPEIRAAARGMMNLSPEDQKTAFQMINFLSQKGKEAKDN